MTDREFTDLKTRLDPGDEMIHRVALTDQEIASLSREQAEDLVAHFGGHVLMLLPQKERDYFEWLRASDPEIWDDLWGGDEEPYMVGISFLADLLPNRRGFLICDLISHQNYDFSTANIADDGSIFLDASLEIVKNNGKLTMPQAFIVEVWRAPIDQWRFAYMYNMPLDEVKEMVKWMLTEGLLMILPEETEQEAGMDSDGQ